MVNLNLKINVNVLQLLRVVVSVALHGVFLSDFVGFALTVRIVTVNTTIEVGLHLF